MNHRYIFVLKRVYVYDMYNVPTVRAYIVNATNRSLYSFVSEYGKLNQQTKGTKCFSTTTTPTNTIEKLTRIYGR